MQVPGDVIDGRFELVERLGSGGMGTVWRARDTVLQREVALKAVRADADASDSTRERVLREARALARLSHPHVVTVHQIIDTDPHPWIVMELVPGVSLQQRLADGSLGPQEAARIGRQVLSALRVAHAAGIQHRDVKPANILLRTDGSAVLTDFGIAALHDATALTATGELVGSPEYMAPERVRGHGDAPASDLWSLGLVLYVCVEGVSPLRRATTLATLAAVLDDPVPPPVRSGPLGPVLAALLVRDPVARPDAERLDALLAQVEAGTSPHWTLPTVAAAPAPTPAPTPTTPNVPLVAGPRRPRKPVLIAGATAVAVVAAAAAVFTMLRTAGGDGGTDAAGGSTTQTSTAPSVRTPSSQQPRESARTPTQGSSPTSSPAMASSPTTPSNAPAGGGRWIGQLYSEPVSSGTGARDRRLALIRETVPEADYLRSDDYASLRPGFWVIYAPGPFGDGHEVLDFCAERGRTTANTCIGRYLSRDPADFAIQCRPPAAQPTGRCGRGR
ncbi:serine/threonine-protein kinase [Streptomyces viridiviolaceus]